MKVLVLGGTGFLGPHVVRHLSEMGHEVTIFHSGQHEPELPPQVKHIHSSLATTPLSRIPSEVRHLSPDVVLHMVPVGESDARLVVETFDGVAGRLVSISSQDVYRAFNRIHRVEPGPPDPVPLTEESPLREKLYPHRGNLPRGKDDPQRYLDDYDKILVERAVMETTSLPGTILRLPRVYGPGDPAHRPFYYLKRMSDGRQVILLDERVSKWLGPRGYVENVAWAIAVAVADVRAARRIYNIAEPDALTEEEWVRHLGQAMNWGGTVVVVPRGHLDVPYDTEQHWPVDSTRIRRELSYSERVSRDEALRRTVAWERSNPPGYIDPAEFDYVNEDKILQSL